MPQKGNIITRAIDRFINKNLEKRGVYYGPSTSVGLPYGTINTPAAINTSLQLSAVYRCVEVISDAIASQSWEILEYSKTEGWKDNPTDPIAYLLNNQPNDLHSPYILMKSLIARVLLYGNGYLHVIRSPIGEPVRLDLVTVDTKRFLREDKTSYYQLGPDHDYIIVDAEDIIHIMIHTQNGLIGESVISHAVNSLDLAIASESSAKGFFLSGANMAGILSTDGKLTKEKATAIKNSWSEAFDVTSGTPGGIAVMEGGLEFSPVNINPRDAQMLETRKFNVVEICRFFGLHPSKVFDDSNLTYSNIEAFQLGFLTDTVSPLDNNIESEFNRKLLRPSKRLTKKLNLNIDELLRANLDAQANFAAKMFQIGGYTPNEIRDKFTKMPARPKGDDNYIQVNMQPVGKSNEPNKKLEDEE